MDVNTKDNSGDVLFLHDSICNEIEIGRLLAGSGCKGDKHRTYTIQDASEFLGTVHHARTTILHVGINDLKTNSAEDTFRFYNELVNKAISKSDKVVLSLLTPSLAKYLNNKVQEMNEMIVFKFNREDKISICHNNNFCINGVINENLFFNNTRLSRDHGIKVLASNLRRTLFPNMQPKKTNLPYKQQHSPRYRDPTHHNFHRNMYNQHAVHNRHEGDSNKLASNLASAILAVLKS